MLHFHVSIRKIVAYNLIYIIYIIIYIIYIRFIIIHFSLPATIFQNRFCNMQHATKARLFWLPADKVVVERLHPLDVI